jgi:hypothetical protein
MESDEDIDIHYPFFVTKGFNQHADESDAERAEQIIDKSVKDADWILAKVRFVIQLMLVCYS